MQGRVHKDIIDIVRCLRWKSCIGMNNKIYKNVCEYVTCDSMYMTECLIYNGCFLNYRDLLICKIYPETYQQIYNIKTNCEVSKLSKNY